jgi:Asp-tRNA(Asn)/Glu-tRNA(Gln) amidotransferase A subunit family amidase
LPVDAEITAALDDLAMRLGRLGAKVGEAQPEGFDLWKHQEVYASLLHAVVFLNLPDEQRTQLVQRLHHSTDPFAPAQVFGLTVTAEQFIGLHAQRERYRASFRAFFHTWDVLLTSVTITPAFPHINQETTFASRTLQINAEMVPYSRLQVYPGLPLGTHARWAADRAAGHRPQPGGSPPITFDALLARAFGGFVPPPGYQAYICSIAHALTPPGVPAYHCHPPTLL